MSCTDSSDDEEAEKLLREATDSQFIKDSMFSEEKPKTQTLQPKPPSLRPAPDEDDKLNPLQVTPQFQQHVAKHLTKILDKQLQEQITNNCNGLQESCCRRPKSGVKLFQTSRSFITLKMRKESVPIGRKPANDSADSEDEEKCKTVAVSGDEVLSGREIVAWSKRSKAKVFRYKGLKNGALQSLDE